MSEEEKDHVEDIKEQKFTRAQPFIETTIADIAKPGNYRIVGTVVNVSEDSLIVQDDTEQIIVSFTDIPTEKPKEGTQIRILGYIELEPEKRLKAMIIQQLTGINLVTYRQINDLELSLSKDES